MYLILGYGNPLRGDDGFGWYAAERLAAAGLNAQALHQLTPELAEPVSQASRVIFIDASREGEPGVLREESVAPASAGAFTHHITPSTLLAIARDLYGHAPDATLFTAAGDSFAYEMALSPKMELALSNLCRRLISWNHMTNPYAAQLGDRASIEVLSTTPFRLGDAIDAMPEERFTAPLAPGKWSPCEIVNHLADCEIAFAFRLRQALAEDHHVIQPFDQDQWAKLCRNDDIKVSQAVFGAIRQWNLVLIQAASPAALAKKVTHPERGEMTFETIVQTMAGHDLNHLSQFESLTQS